MKRQPTWDQYEVALLVDAYVRVTEQGENKKEVLQILSKKLRQKAKNEGLEIDDTFRNINGMMWQFGFVECAFKRTGYGKHMPSKLFQNIVEIYQNRNAEFMQIYHIAENKAIGSTSESTTEKSNLPISENRTAFMEWLYRNGHPKNRTQYICNAFDNASGYAQGHRIIKKNFWEIDSEFEVKQYFEKLQKDKIFNVTRKDDAKIIMKSAGLYISFIQEIMCANRVNVEENNVASRIVGLVAKKYVYGFRIGSVIERMKLRKYLIEENISFDGNDEELEQLIIENGFVSNGKVLIDLKNKQEKLSQEIDLIFNSGISVIYYESFFERNDSLMAEVHITTAETLKEILKEKRNDLVFSKNYFTNIAKVTEGQAVSQEINRVWGEKVLATVDDLSSLLPYIPYDKVRFYLSLCQNFVWVSEGVYTRVDTIKITETETNSIVSYAASEIERKGYLSLSELPLGDIVEENYELSEYAIFFGVFSKCLSDKYCLRGRIVTEENSEFDATTLMQQYCIEQEEITLDEAISKVEEFTGVADRRIAYPVLYGEMIRVNEQLFVSQSRINFDVEKIDAQIDRFTKDGFAAIKEVTTFALFPECGFPWNHYLLESYCYRFSKKYSYRTNLFNGRNAGAIIDSEFTWDYQELMAQAVARSSINVEEKEIGTYLCEAGYMARSKFGGIKEIAQRAITIRKDRN